jgi:hypothetical protein
MSRLKGIWRVTAVVAASALVAVPALARPAGGLQDLVDARGISGDSALEQRGYVNISGHAQDGGQVSYWWNASNRQCVQVMTRNGRYSELNEASRGDCNQRDNNAGAAVAAVGAVAVIGALLASHRSHHHDDNAHAQAQADEAQFERGFQDGLHGESYHNYENTPGYSRGYEAGNTQRAYNTPHRDSNRRRSGYTPYVQVNDLNGAGVGTVNSELQRRGFSNVNNFTSGSTDCGIWYNRSTRQCVRWYDDC